MTLRTDAGTALVVIPCLNEERHLHALLDALVRDVPAALIVVADGGSTDASRTIVTEAAARHPNVRLLDNPARVQSAGVNLAVRRFGAGRRWLVRLDAHCGYPPGYAADLIARGEALDAESVVVPMRTLGIGCFQRAVAAAQNSVLGTGGSAHRHVGAGRYVDHGHHALMRLDGFAAAGGYCEDFSHNEDAELDHRLRQAGARIWLEPALAIDYYPRGDPGGLFRQYRNYGAGRARTLQRHRMRPKLRQLLPLAVVPAAALLLLAPAVWWLALPAIAWLGASLGYGLLLGIQARDRCVALAGTAAILMHSGWALGFLRQRLFGRPPGPAPAPFVCQAPPPA